MQAVSQLGLFCHKKQGNEEKVIAYFSRSLNRTQRQYCTTRRELLAVVKALAHFHPYLYGRNFVVRTDHCSLRWLVNFKYAEGQLARWLQKIQQYDLKIVHRPGKYHLNADNHVLGNIAKIVIELKQENVQQAKSNVEMRTID